MHSSAAMTSWAVSGLLLAKNDVDIELMDTLAGTGGQCLMSPPEYNGGSYPYVWYNLGGVLVNFLLAACIRAADMKQFARAMKNNSSILRTQYAQTLLLDKDEKKAQSIRQAFEKAAERYPHPCEIAGERELLALTDTPEKYKEMACDDAGV